MVHKVLSENLRNLMRNNAGLGTQAAVGKAAKIDQKSVGRILNISNSPTLKQIDALAHAFGLNAWQILIPGLDPSNHPVIQQSAPERDLYARLQQLLKEAKN